MKMYMAIDQYGHTYHGLKHPRKELCERLCNSHVEKMYQDKKGRNNGILWVCYRWVMVAAVRGSAGRKGGVIW
jgi:hypothetical protein